MTILSYVNEGFDGSVVTVEVDLRRGIPGMDIVGLPDSAVREARQRVRAAIRNSEYRVPRERILINLAPAGVRKEGTFFDLPIAVALLTASGQVSGGRTWRILIMGELELSGTVRPVNGVLAAVVSALKDGVEYCLVPQENYPEAFTVGGRKIVPISHLKELPYLFTLLLHGRGDVFQQPSSGMLAELQYHELEALDFADMSGQTRLKRACEIAAAGRHHMLIFGPPGVGKTMAGMRLPGLLPLLERQESIEVTRIYSIGGMLPTELGLIRRPPLRMPHHTASREGLIGGGSQIKPGEISYAHHGVLFLDEAMSFSLPLLQALREPMERGFVQIARSGAHYWYPAKFQLILAINPCPCGKLGQPGAVCMCSPLDLHRYWKKLGAAFLDRIDLRVPVEPEPLHVAETSATPDTAFMADKVMQAIRIQRDRYGPNPDRRNAEMSMGEMSQHCILGPKALDIFQIGIRELNLSSRAGHSVLKVARTIADLEGRREIISSDVSEAMFYRRYAESDYYWRAA